MAKSHVRLLSRFATAACTSCEVAGGESAKLALVAQIHQMVRGVGGGAGGGTITHELRRDPDPWPADHPQELDITTTQELEPMELLGLVPLDKSSNVALLAFVAFDVSLLLSRIKWH